MDIGTTIRQYSHRDIDTDEIVYPIQRHGGGPIVSFVPIVATIPIVAVLTNHHPNLFERIVRTSVSSMVFCVSGHPKQRPPPFDWSTCSSCCKCFGDDGTLYHSDSTHPLPHVVVVVVNRHRSWHPHRESLATVLSVAQSHTIVHRICLHHVTHVDTS